MPIRLILRRLAQAIPLLLGVVVLNVALIQCPPAPLPPPCRGMPIP